MRSPRFAPAALLVSAEGRRILIDGGAESPVASLDGWLLTDDRAELAPEIRRRAAALHLIAAVRGYSCPGLDIRPRRVAHTSHPTYAYDIRWRGRRIVWAPEFWRFPRWAAGADILFADAAGWSRPIRFAHGVGGHASAVDVARTARRLRIRRLVFAHIGRPTIRAIDAGMRPAYGEFGRDGRRYIVRARECATG
jgi:hypothetical protein